MLRLWQNKYKLTIRQAKENRRNILLKTIRVQRGIRALG